MSNTLTMNIVAHDHASKVFKGVGVAAEHGGKKLKEFGERSKAVLATAGMAAGAAGAALLVKGFSDVLEQDAAVANFSAKLGISKSDSAKLGKISGQLYAENYGESLSQINDVITQVMQNQTLAAFGDVKDSAARILTITQTFGQDSARIINATGQLLSNGLVRDAKEATDVIATGFQSGVDKSGDFLDSLNEYGVQFSKLGLSAAEATGLMSQGILNGARDSDTVADTLKEFSIRAIDGSKTTMQGFKALGLSGKTMGADIAFGGDKAKSALQLTLDKLNLIKDPVKKNAAAVALFGTKAEDMGAALAGLDVRTAVNQLGTVKGATDDMAKALGDTTSAKFQTFKRNLEMNVSSKLQETIVRMSGFLESLGGVANFIADHLETFIILGTVIGTIVGVIKTITFVTGLWTAAQELLNLSFLTNPVFLIITGIALLVVGVIAAYKHFKGFRDVVDAVGRASVIAFKALWGWAKTAFNWIKDNWKKISVILIGPVATGIIWIVSNWGKVRRMFVDFFVWSGGKWLSFKSAVLSVWKSISSVVLNVFSGLRRGWSFFTSGVSTMFNTAVNNVVKSINRIKSTFWSVVDAVRNLWNSSIGGFSFSAPSWVPGIGGQGIRIPFLAEGGIATRPTLAMIGEGGEPEMVLPLSKARQAGFGGSSGMSVNIYVTQPLGSPEAIAKAVSTALRASSVRGNTFATGRA